MIRTSIGCVYMVALRKESVDRNRSKIKREITVILSLSARRAWIEILPANETLLATTSSLSARRAWIEIIPFRQCRRIASVALRKESVDRNGVRYRHISFRRFRSLSARRAWIEISIIKTLSGGILKVALRKESVDRNISRALTFLVISWSLSARRAWIEILSVCKKSHIT